MGKVISIATADNGMVAARFYEPRQATRAVIIINPAMAVASRFYRHYAAFLAQHGFAVISYDYRGIGDSHPGDRQHIDLLTWAQQDFSAVLQYARQHFADKRLLLLGHSFGGQIPLLCPQARELDALVLISAQSGYWRLWPLPQRWLLASLWYFIMPVSIRVFGRFPSKALRLGEDLPFAAARQWARWCRHSEYLSRDNQKNKTAFSDDINIKIIGFEDDSFAPAKAVKSLARMYSRSEESVQILKPSHYGVKRIGHFGLFSRKRQDDLWQQSLKWIEEALACESAA